MKKDVVGKRRNIECNVGFDDGTPVTGRGRKSSKRGPIGIWIQYNLHIHLVHDMFQ